MSVHVPIALIFSLFVGFGAALAQPATKTLTVETRAALTDLGILYSTNHVEPWTGHRQVFYSIPAKLIQDKALNKFPNLSNDFGLSFSQGTALPNGLIKELVPLEHLIALDLGDAVVSELALPALKQLPKLEYLTLGGKLIGDKGLKSVGECKTLRWLDLSRLPVTPAGIKSLGSMPNLEYLRLKGATISATNFPKLTGLEITGPIQVSATLLKELRESDQVTHLSLIKCTLTEAGMREIGDMKQLVALDLSGTNIQNNNLKSLRTLPKLKRLTVRGTRVTNAGMDELNDIKSLQILILDETPVTDVGVIKLLGSPSLKAISIPTSSMTDKLLKAYSEARRLHVITNTSPTLTSDLNESDASMTSLFLNGAGITDAGLAELKHLKSLETLMLTGTHATDKGMEHLKQLPMLKRLTIHTMKLTDKGLRELASLESLEQLTMWGCAVTPEGILAFRKLLPTCKVSQTRSTVPFPGKPKQ